MLCIRPQTRPFAMYSSSQNGSSTIIARKTGSRLLLCQAALRPCSTSAVATMAEKNKTFSALLACQNTVLGIITEPINLIPSEMHPPLSIHGLESEKESDVGATIAAWEPPPLQQQDQEHSNPVRWVSASALSNASLGFGTTRLMAWAAPHVACPHFVLELGNNVKRAQGTLSFAQRSDLVLDLAYLDKYYNKRGTGLSTFSFNDVFNRCLAFQNTFQWHHYQVPQADMKPVIANSISYTFPVHEESIQAFTDAAADAAQLWTELVIAAAEEEENENNQWSRERQVKMRREYDVRHEQVVRFDPGNMIAQKLFGKEATQNLLNMTVGRGF